MAKQITKKGDITQVGDTVRVEAMIGVSTFKILVLVDADKDFWEPKPEIYDSEEAALQVATKL